jgi:hypothetical protein
MAYSDGFKPVVHKIVGQLPVNLSGKKIMAHLFTEHIKG